MTESTSQSQPTLSESTKRDAERGIKHATIVGSDYPLGDAARLLLHNSKMQPALDNRLEARRPALEQQQGTERLAQSVG